MEGFGIPVAERKARPEMMTLVSCMLTFVWEEEGYGCCQMLLDALGFADGGEEKKEKSESEGSIAVIYTIGLDCFEHSPFGKINPGAKVSSALLQMRNGF